MLYADTLTLYADTLTIHAETSTLHADASTLYADTTLYMMTLLHYIIRIGTEGKGGGWLQS